MLTPILDALLKELDSLRALAAPIPLPHDTLVAAGGDVQAALDTADFGTTIWLAKGVTYKVNLRLRNRVGVGTITVRTAGLTDTVLVPGVRVTPLDAPNMAKLAPLDELSPTLVGASGAHDYTFIGIEFTGNITHPDRDLIQLGTINGVFAKTYAEQPSNITFDRCSIHADPTVGGHRGILLDGVNLKVVNCDIRGFWEVGRDSQAIATFQAAGPLLIDNCYLEASGENFIAGGSDPLIVGAIPSDITFRNNYVFKPLSWKTTHVGSVKNLFELKNAQRVVVEGNLFENCWSDAQNGSAILVTVRNQDGTAPWSTVKDVTFKNNVIKNVSLFAFNILAIDNHFPTQPATGIKILNNLFINVGRGLQVTEAIDGLEIGHNTFTGITYSLLTLDTATGKLKGVNFHDNVTPGGIYGTVGSGTTPGTPSLDAFLAADYKFIGNVIEGNVERTISYPSGNFSIPVGTLATKLGPTFKYLGVEGVKPGADIDTLTTVNKNLWL